MDNDGPARKVFEAVLEGIRKTGRSKLRWNGQVGETFVWQLETKAKEFNRLEEDVIEFAYDP